MKADQARQLAATFIGVAADVFEALRLADVAQALRGSEGLAGELTRALASGDVAPAVLVVDFITAAQAILDAAGAERAASWLADLAPALRRLAAELLNRPLEGERLDGLADLR